MIRFPLKSSELIPCVCYFVTLDLPWLRSSRSHLRSWCGGAGRCTPASLSLSSLVSTSLWWWNAGGSSTASSPGQTASHSSYAASSPGASRTTTGWSGEPWSATASSPTSSASDDCPPGWGRGSPPPSRSWGPGSWGRTRQTGLGTRPAERCTAATGGSRSSGALRSSAPLWRRGLLKAPRDTTACWDR